MTLNRIKLLLGPFAFLLIWQLCDLSPGKPQVTVMAASAAWMAIWWLTEAVHLAVTALLPMVLFPLLGVADSKQVAVQYMDPIIFMFIGGFIIAFAIERWQLHRRIALKVLMTVGTSPSRILFGVMFTTYLLSMWISNTATVMMLLAAVLAVVYQVEEHLKDEKASHGLAAALLIALAYSATIGGMATLVGTPTNMIFLRSYHEHFPGSSDMSFFNWFAVGFPVSLVFLGAAFLVLKFVFIRKQGKLALDRSYFRNGYRQLGPMTYEEKAVGAVFSITAILWFTREDIDFGLFSFTGWGHLFTKGDFISDSTVAVLMALLLFLIPSKAEKGRALMTWKDTAKLPFDVILLFGGGFALAKGFDVSGLSDWIAQHLGFAAGMNIYLFVFLLCLVVTLISEFASNVACIQLMIPILLAIQKDMGVHPLMLLVPATLAASLGFMLPVATAPNTIVFGTHRIRVNEMLKAGFLLDIIGIILITLTMMLAGY